MKLLLVEQMARKAVFFIMSLHRMFLCTPQNLLRFSARCVSGGYDLSK